MERGFRADVPNHDVAGVPRRVGPLAGVVVQHAQRVQLSQATEHIKDKDVIKME